MLHRGVRLHTLEMRGGELEGLYVSRESKFHVGDDT